MGCNGGNSYFSINYVAENGIESEEVYPYTNGSSKVTEPCNYDASKVVY